MQRLWWLNLIRGIVALIVGTLILGWPTVGTTLFVNFLAIFWLASGLMSLQWGISTHQKRGLWLVAGVVGTVVGVALILRSFYERYLEPSTAVRILGALALFVGLIIIDALGPVSKLLAGGWAFIGGLALILQAFQMRRAVQVKRVD